jgi:thiosulfate dehydrogenase [quinone] large subunit
MDKKTKYFLGILRLEMAWMMLWAFWDKTFGLGFATEPAKAWINGGSPTYGFLAKGAIGPFVGFYQSLAGQAWVEWAFMLGLLLIGVALLLGVTMRLACWSGFAMMILMYGACIQPENNPFLDDHLIYATLFLLFLFSESGRYLGIGDWWASREWVKKSGLLK